MHASTSKLLELDNVTLEFENAALDAIAQKAIDRKIGARGLRAVLESVMTKVMYDIPSDPTISEVLITRACVEDGSGAGDPAQGRRCAPEASERRITRHRRGRCGHLGVCAPLLWSVPASGGEEGEL